MRVCRRPVADCEWAVLVRTIDVRRSLAAPSGRTKADKLSAPAMRPVNPLTICPSIALIRKSADSVTPVRGCTRHFRSTQFTLHPATAPRTCKIWHGFCEAALLTQISTGDPSLERFSTCPAQAISTFFFREARSRTRPARRAAFRVRKAEREGGEPRPARRPRG
ncbi:hypothetical protein PsYK624_165430 [Phanerochaete sordida]|uniref:Uncharacterized protein n=1 Tax=Phanerochaete sordida TaxID=48140 RepID=A0A9P3LLZ0_9APHY|nr:hypothetical protein PsYK624_165430 [Phanerochaete sordida]